MSLRDAIAEALSEVESEGTEVSEAQEETEDTPEASTGGMVVGESDDGEPESEGTPEGEATDEVPTEYFGLDLSGLEPKQRAEIIAELRKRDDYIGKLLRETAGSEEPDEPEAETTAPADPTDAEILEALGLDPENPLDEQAAKVAIPLVRRQLEQDKLLAQLIEQQELAEIDRTWRTTLSAMEREFGPLPAELDHDKVMEFAAREGIANPMDAYWRIVGPARAALNEAIKRAEQRRQELVTKKKASATTRPAASTSSSEADIEAPNVRLATREVVRRLLAESGLS